MSLSTVDRHFSKGYYSASKIHPPRAVKFKPHKKKRADVVPSAIKKERTYADFLAHMEREGLSAHTQLDTVIGVSGGKVILTVHFTAFNFMFRLLLENKTAVQAALKFQEVNGVRRNICSGKFPYEMFMFAFSEELAALLGISYVALEDVMQSPRLLKG